MLKFKYKNGKSIQAGTIHIFSYSFPIEAEIEANGWSFYVIVGKHKNGHYICIPNWSVGSELAALDDRFWNNERLVQHTKLGRLNSSIIATALVELSHVI
jgi:hypothetical protein